MTDNTERHPMSDMTYTLSEIKRVTEAATEGPWDPIVGDTEGQPNSEYVRRLFANREQDGTSTGELHLTLAFDPTDRARAVVPALTGDGPQAPANAEFIAMARTALPELVAAVERVRELADTLHATPGVIGSQGIARDIRVALDGARHDR